MQENEYSDSGDPIYRYDGSSRKDFTPAFGNGENIEAISAHIEKYIGVIESVFHEIVSDIVHIDIYWIKPTDKYPFHILITSGMSDLPMNVPEGLEENRFAELCILLPPNWKIGTAKGNDKEDHFKDEKNYWPVRWLKIIARFPHEYDTWVGYGHTIPNGENAEPFSDDTKLGCMLLMPSVSLDDKFFELAVGDKMIRFYCLCPLYREEMDYKLKKGLDGLLEKFEKNGINDVVNISRKNTCSKKGLWGLW